MSPRKRQSYRLLRCKDIRISGKLPEEVIGYLKEINERDSKGLQMAFTIANMKATPKTINDEENLFWVKRKVLRELHAKSKTNVSQERPRSND